MALGLGLGTAGLAAVLVVTALTVAPAIAAETPKRGGTLTFAVPADAPPSFDGHREGTFAMLHVTAPFYSVLIRINPENASSTTDFVCDVCTEVPKPTDEG
jgi:peptide/nickel transport system substrate-binding protein